MNVNNSQSGSRAGAAVPAEDNVPGRFESFLLGPGEKKVTEEPDTRKLNTHLQAFARNPTVPYGKREEGSQLSHLFQAI